MRDRPVPRARPGDHRLPGRGSGGGAAGAAAERVASAGHGDPALAHEPLGWRPTVLLVTVRRYRCARCGRVWRQDTSRAAEPRARLSRRGLRWALEGLVVGHLSMARVAAALGGFVEHREQRGTRRGPPCPDRRPRPVQRGQVIGVDEHVWRHTRRGDKYVTVIIDLTPVRDRTGPARLLDMVEGRSKTAFAGWLADRDQAWRDRVQVVAMDGFTGFKTAAAEQLPDAVAVMDPFHVVRLAGDALDECRRRVQQDLHGHRGPAGDPLYKARRTLHTGADLLTDKQKARLDALFADDEPPAGPGHLGDLPTDGHRLPRPRPGRRPHPDPLAHRQPRPRRPSHAHRGPPARPDPEPARRRRPGVLRPARHQQRTHRSHL